MRTAVPFLLSLLLTACGRDWVDIASSQSRDTAPSSDDVPQLASDNSRFAYDLYRAEVGSDETSNVFFSPYSISVALAMTYAGAANNTASQIAQTMHFTLPPDRLHAAFDAVDLALGGRQSVKLHVANSIWDQRSLAFQSPFLDVLARDYGSEVRGVDFVASSDAARSAIDGWVSDQTDGKIQNLFPPGSLDSSTRVVLVNAIYFDAKWKTTFNSGQTHAATFKRLDGSTVQAEEMSTTVDSLAIAQTDQWLAADILYQGAQTSMLIVMPADGQFASVEASLDSTVPTVLGTLQSFGDIQLSLPKFTLQGAAVSLTHALASMGMVDAFDATKADFSAMVAGDPIFVRDVVHQAYVRVDENGTEAAAATGSEGTNAVLVPTTVTFDRPFFFFIRDIPTGALLFVGRMMDPTH